MSASAPTATHAHPLSDEQQAFFKEHGYVVLRGFASQQVSAALLAAAQDGLASAAAPVELETDVGYAGAPTSREAEGGQTVRRLLDADSRGTPYTEWARDPRVALFLRLALTWSFSTGLVKMQTGGGGKGQSKKKTRGKNKRKKKSDYRNDNRGGFVPAAATVDLPVTYPSAGPRVTAAHLAKLLDGCGGGDRAGVGRGVGIGFGVATCGLGAGR